ncbi:STN domain-containing protein [Sphingobium scionense]
MVASATTAQAQPAQRIGVDLPAQPLGRSLQALALLSHRTVLADATLIGDRQAPSLQGAYSIEDALRRLLEGSGLTFDRVDESFVVRRRARPATGRAIATERVSS